MALLNSIPIMLLATAVTIVGGSLTSGEANRPTEAELAFADAPHGVDPIVTGPTSAAFKQRRKAAGCDGAEWPDVSLACFPD